MNWKRWVVVMGALCAFFVVKQAGATCANYTAYSDGQVLTATSLNSLQTSYTNCINAVLDGDIFTGNMSWYNGTDILMYSDAGATATFKADGATGVVSGSPLIFSKTYILPEYIQVETDFVPILPVETSWAPNGITVIKAGIKLDANRAYSVVFEDWSDPATASADIATVATGAGDKEMDSAALTTDVDAGHIVGIDLPTTTGAKFLQAYIVYKVKP